MSIPNSFLSRHIKSFSYGLMQSQREEKRSHIRPSPETDVAPIQHHYSDEQDSVHNSPPRINLASLSHHQRTISQDSWVQKQAEEHKSFIDKLSAGEIYKQAEISQRRKGFILTPVSVSPRPVAMAEPASNPSISTKTKVMIDGALKGTSKLRNMGPESLDHIFKMLEAHDKSGLSAVVKDGNPLRSFATGIKIGEHILNDKNQEALPAQLNGALDALKTFYSQNKELVNLGNATEDHLYKQRNSDEVQSLRSAFDEACRLLGNLNRAFEEYK